MLSVTAPSSAESESNELVEADGSIPANKARTEALISFLVTMCTGTGINLLSLISFSHLHFSGRFADVLRIGSIGYYMLWKVLINRIN